VVPTGNGIPVPANGGGTEGKLYKTLKPNTGGSTPVTREGQHRPPTTDNRLKAASSGALVGHPQHD